MKSQRTVTLILFNKKGVGMMGKDRQEKKLRNSKRVESDRDPDLHNNGSTRLDTPDEARKDQ